MKFIKLILVFVIILASERMAAALKKRLSRRTFESKKIGFRIKCKERKIQNKHKEIEMFIKELEPAERCVKDFLKQEAERNERQQAKHAKHDPENEQLLRVHTEHSESGENAISDTTTVKHEISISEYQLSLKQLKTYPNKKEQAKEKILKLEEEIKVLKESLKNVSSN